jgi:hypothetical protein
MARHRATTSRMAEHCFLDWDEFASARGQGSPSGVFIETGEIIHA